MSTEADAVDSSHEFEAGPRISVITISFNHLEGLQQTLRSVDAQTYGNLELVVVDGGSSDGTKVFLENYRSTHPATLISEPDDGIYHAMNKGIALSTGDLAVFMNAGDCFTREGVSSMIAESYQGESWLWGYGCARVMDAEGRPLSVTAFIPFKKQRLALGVSTVPHQATFMKLSLLRDLEGFNQELGLAADQDLLMRAAQRATPRLWADFFADFEGGGRGSSRSPWAFPLDMKRARARNGIQFGGSLMVDRLATFVVVCSRILLEWQAALRRRLGWHFT